MQRGNVAAGSEIGGDRPPVNLTELRAWAPPPGFAGIIEIDQVEAARIHSLARLANHDGYGERSGELIIVRVERFC